ncbi:MAG: ABC transporter permease, partial [Pseudoflavonifractor sp.]
MENLKDLPQSLFTRAEVDSGEKEKISRPNLSSLQDGWIRLRQNKAAVVSLFILLVIIGFAIFGPIFSQYDYAKTDYTMAFQSPSAQHPFGTDKFGRDQFARIWYGTRISLLIALAAACLDLFVGVTYGAVSALVGGKVDAVMQRVIEVLV